MAGKIRILGFAGSLRKGSYSKAALRAASAKQAQGLSQVRRPEDRPGGQARDSIKAMLEALVIWAIRIKK